MDLDKLTLGEKIVLGAGAVLAIDLVALPWFDVSVGAGPYSVSITRTAIESPKGFLGLLALLGVLAMIGQIVAAKFTSAKLPEVPMSWGKVHMIAGFVVLGLLVVKLVTDMDYLGFGAYLAILLAGAVAFGGFTISKDEPDTAAG